jgi:microcystin-dependent protein
MAYYLSPIFNTLQALTNEGLIAPGSLLRTYLAGTTTEQFVYSSSTGTQRSNPVVADAYGRFGPIWISGGLSMKFVLQTPAGVDVPNGTFDNVTGVNDVSGSSSSSGAQWVATGLTPSYVSSSQFSVTGNQTTIFPIATRVKYVCSAGTLYGTVSAVTFSSSTTVTIVPDGSGLDAGLTSVQVGLITAINRSVDAGAVTYKSSVSYSSPTVGSQLQSNATAIAALQAATFNQPPPVGTIVMWPVTAIPNGWLELNGGTFSSSTYPALYTLLGSTTLPDMRGMFPRGWDHGRGTDTGRTLLSQQAQQVLNHKHVGAWGEAGAGPFGNSTTSNHTGSNATDSDNTWWWTNDGGNNDGSPNATGVMGAENRPVNFSLIFMIKAKEVTS